MGGISLNLYLLNLGTPFPRWHKLVMYDMGQDFSNFLSQPQGFFGPTVDKHILGGADVPLFKYNRFQLDRETTESYYFVQDLGVLWK